MAVCSTPDFAGRVCPKGAARAWRLRVPDRELSPVDRVQGEHQQNLEREVGDFVLLPMASTLPTGRRRR